MRTGVFGFIFFPKVAKRMTSIDAIEYPIKSLEVCALVMAEAVDMLQDGDDSLNFLSTLTE